MGAMWRKRGALDGEPKDARAAPVSHVKPSACVVGVYFNNGRKSLPCLIRDVAYEGARIIIADPAAYSE